MVWSLDNWLSEKMKSTLENKDLIYYTQQIGTHLIINNTAKDRYKSKI